jgi:ankyrin repeat protein
MDGPALIAAVEAMDMAALKAALRGAPKISARAMVKAGGLAWRPGLAALLDAGGDPNASFKGYRPLHALIQEKPHEGGSSTPARVKCVAWMLARGADPEQRGAWPPARAVLVAAFTGVREYVDVLIAGGARIDAFVESALGDAKALERRLKEDAGLATARDGERGLTVLHCCAGSRLGRADAKTARGLLACATLLLDAGADPNAETRSWLHDVAPSYFAIGSEQEDMLALLLSRGADATGALSSAAWSGTDAMLDLVLAKGARLDAARDGGKPILNQLVRWGQLEKARRLLARGASPNEPDENGWTAVHQAVSRGNARILKELLDAGGDPNRRDAAGKTPRGMAKGAGRAELVALLGARPG